MLKKYSTIIGAMTMIGRPCSTSEITEAIERDGFKASGKTSVQTMVSSELWRMASKEVGVKRVRHGTYELIPSAQT